MSIALIATIAVIVFLAAFLAVGFYRGFLRIILTTFSLVITLVLVGIITPYAADYIENSTVIGPRIENSIENYVSNRLGTVSQSATTVQNNFIDSLPITAKMKADLKAGNTLGDYVDQGVSSFSEYIAVNLTTLIIKIMCYVLLFIVIFLIIRLILRLSKVVNHIPIVGGINRVFGGLFGLIEGVIFLWIICLIIMMLSGTEFGISCQNVIAESRILTFIYEHNYLMSIVNSVLGLFDLKVGNGAKLL